MYPLPQLFDDGLGGQSGASVTSMTIIRSGSTGRPRQAIGSMASDCSTLRTRFWIRSNPSSSDCSHSWFIPWASRSTTSLICRWYRRKRKRRSQGRPACIRSRA